MKTLDEILQASKFIDLFKTGSKKELRSLLKQTHPDLHPHNKVKAERAFVHVNLLWGHKNQPTVTVTVDSHLPKTTATDTIITKKNEYTTVREVRKDNGVTTFTADDNVHQKVTLLIATHPKISTMLIDGIKNLKTIRREIPELYKEFFPETTDAFHVTTGGVKFSGIAQKTTGTFYTLKEVLEDYPEGIHGRDLAWIYRRMLVSIGNAHDAGIAHGSPTLNAFLIDPETHALILSDWQYSKEIGTEMTMLNEDIKHHYAADKKTSIKKDLVIISGAAHNLTGAKTPVQMKRFFKGMINFPTLSAGEALGEFDELLMEVYGQRTFHPFAMRR